MNINKYLTEATMPLKTNNIKRIFNNQKSGNYEIDGKMVKVDVSGDTMVLKYPSDFFELTYILLRRL